MQVLNDFIYNRSMKNIITIIIVSIIVIGLVIGLIISLRPDVVTENPLYHVGNTAGNLLNGGLFAEADGKVYFSNSYEQGNLYVMNSDGTDIKKLNDLTVSSINVGGDYLYFCQGPARFTGEGFGLFRANTGLYRSRLDGRNVVTLKVGTVMTATLCGNEVFFLFNNERDSSRPIRLYKIGTDGENESKVSDEIINPSSYDNGIIYFSRTEDDHFIHGLEVRNGFTSVILEANTYNAIYDNGYIYYMDLDNNYRLCRYSIYENRIEVLTHDRVDLYNVGYGMVYYQKNSRTEPALIRMYSDGSNPEVVREGHHNSINMTSWYVYFQAFGDTETTYLTPVHGFPSVSIFRP